MGEKVELLTEHGETIKVVVTCIRPNRVLLGFEASKKTAILRGEAKKVAPSKERR